MDTPAEITLYIALLGGAIVAGGQLFCLLAVIPAFGDWSPGFGVAVHQHALTERPHRYLKVVSAIAVIAAIATIAIEHSTDGPVVLTAIGFLLSLVNAIFSQREWPINDEINSYGDSVSEEQLSQYADLRRAWDSQHKVRTIASLSAFASFAAAAAFF